MISRTEEKLKAAAEEFGKYVACGEIIPFEILNENLEKMVLEK